MKNGYKNGLKYLPIIAIGFFNYIYAAYAYITFHNNSEDYTDIIEATDQDVECMNGTTGKLVIPPGDNQAFTFNYSNSGACAFEDSYQNISVTLIPDKSWLEGSVAGFDWFKNVGEDPFIYHVEDPDNILHYDSTHASKYLDMSL